MADTRTSKSQVLTFEQFQRDEIRKNPFSGQNEKKLRERFNQYLAQGMVGTDSVLKPNLPNPNEEEDPEAQMQRRRQGTFVTGFRSDTGTVVTGMKSGPGSRLGQ